VLHTARAHTESLPKEPSDDEGIGGAFAVPIATTIGGHMRGTLTADISIVQPGSSRQIFATQQERTHFPRVEPACRQKAIEIAGLSLLLQNQNLRAVREASLAHIVTLIRRYAASGVGRPAHVP
jgi:hypothetical protein